MERMKLVYIWSNTSVPLYNPNSTSFLRFVLCCRLDLNIRHETLRKSIKRSECIEERSGMLEAVGNMHWARRVA